jgi:hypothetical protein
MITVVLNSCGRLDLLQRTLASFNSFNTYPVKEFIIVDDSGSEDIHNKLRQEYSSHYTLVLEPHRGLIPCVDDGCSRVKTEYFFKLEEDWEFYQSGFIERSMNVLASRSDIMHVWLRDQRDTNAHPIEPELYSANGVGYKMLALNFLGQWNGFTFNPSVWRLSDYKKLAPFEQIAGSGNMGTQEMNIGYWYYKLFGYRAAILFEGYVKHIGWGRRSYTI